MRNFWKDEQGQDMVEYSLLLAFIAMAGVGLYTSLNGSINTIWTNADGQMSTAASTSST